MNVLWVNEINPCNADTDGDDSTTTDPLSKDSDNDNHQDGQEDTNKNGKVDEGESDPNDVTSKPSRAMPWIPLLLLN